MEEVDKVYYIMCERGIHLHWVATVGCVYNVYWIVFIKVQSFNETNDTLLMSVSKKVYCLIIINKQPLFLETDFIKLYTFWF